MRFSSVVKLLLVTTIASTPGASADELDVFSPQEKPREQLARLLLDAADQQLQKRQAAVGQLHSQAAVEKRQQQFRAFLLQQLKLPSQRTPLNAQVTGVIADDGFRREKLSYESRPRHHVTATLYLPTHFSPPFPGVLLPCGHANEGKAFFMEQKVAALLAKHGIAVLCYDPVGQGERFQIAGAPQGRLHYRTTDEHTLAGIGAVLIGQQAATDHIWDGMRSIDYLASRPEIDARRIGCTGNSGGGCLTSYLMVLDDRISAAMPVCWLTTYRRLLSTRGSQDAEQNIHGFLAAGFDLGDYVLARAPRPTLIGAGIRDSTFDIGGVREIHDEAKNIYRLFGAEQQLGLAEADEEHGFSQPLRERCVRWFRQQFFGVDEPVQEPELTVLKPEQLWVTPTGSVLHLENERTIYDVHADALRETPRPANAAPPTATPTPGRDPQSPAARKFDAAREQPLVPRNVLQRDGYEIEKHLLSISSGGQLPVLLFVPAHRATGWTLYLHDQGKAADAAVGGPIERLVRAGQVVVAPDLSGIGELESRGMSRVAPYDWSRNLLGPNLQEGFLASLLGDTLVDRRRREIVELFPFFLTRCATSLDSKLSTLTKRVADQVVLEPCRIIAVGDCAVPALQVAINSPNRFAHIELANCLESWTKLVSANRPHRHHASVSPVALAGPDIPELIRQIDPKKIVVRNRLDPRQPSDRPTYSNFLSHEEVLAGWIAIFDGETTFGFAGAKTEFNGTQSLLRGGTTTSHFANYELIAHVIEPGTLTLSGQRHEVARGWQTLASRGVTGTIQLDDKLLVASLCLRPVQLTPTINGRDLLAWQPRSRPKIPPEKQPRWTIEHGAIRAVGGPGALEYAPGGTPQLFGNFMLQIDVCTRSNFTNGGLFFRNQPGTSMMGYEAQIHHRLYDHARGEHGWSTGAIDDRQHARRLVAVDHVPFRMTVIAHGRHMATWVNGYQTTDWTDDRTPHENPRSGCRVEPGAIQFQAHDPQTDIEFRQLLISELP